MSLAALAACMEGSLIVLNGTYLLDICRIGLKEMLVRIFLAIIVSSGYLSHTLYVLDSEAEKPACKHVTFIRMQYFPAYRCALYPARIAFQRHTMLNKHLTIHFACYFSLTIRRRERYESFMKTVMSKQSPYTDQVFISLFRLIVK